MTVEKVSVYRCTEGCDAVVPESEVDFDDALYECSNDGFFLRSDSPNGNHQCPQCNKFASKVGDGPPCPQCQQAIVEEGGEQYLATDENGDSEPFETEEEAEGWIEMASKRKADKEKAKAKSDEFFRRYEEEREAEAVVLLARFPAAVKALSAIEPIESRTLAGAGYFAERFAHCVEEAERNPEERRRHITGTIGGSISMPIEDFLSVCELAAKWVEHDELVNMVGEG